MKKNLAYESLSRRLLAIIVPVIVLSMLSAPHILCAQSEQDLVRVRIFTLKNISSDEAKNYFQLAQIGKSILAIPGSAAISVTAEPEGLVAASNIIKLVDSAEKYDIQLLDVPEDANCPTAEQVQEKLGSNYSVGTLLGGSPSEELIKVIADKHVGRLLLITPQELTAKITADIQSLYPMTAAEEAEPNLPAADSIVFTDEPEVVEAKAETETQVLVGGKPQSEEDKFLAEVMSQLAEQKTAEAIAKEQNAEDFAMTIEKTAEPEMAFAPETSEEPQQGQEETAKDIQQPEPEPKAVMPVIDIPNGEEELGLDLPEKVEIVTLIELVGKYLNLNYLYDDAKIRGDVTIKVQGKLKVKQLYELLENTLKFRGFVMSRKGNLVTIVPEAEVLAQDPTFAGDVQPGDVVATNVFRLDYISTSAAKKLLIGMKLGNDATITEIQETGTLVITEYASRMKRVEDLLDLVDVPGPPKEFKLRVLKYTLAESLVPKIQTLAEQLGTVDITIGTSTAAAAKPTSAAAARARRTRTPAPAATTDTSAKSTAVFVDFDKRTNRVLMIGMPDEIAAVDQIIDSLDVPQKDLRVIHEYEIQYVDTESVVNALKELGVIDSSSASGYSSSSSKTPNPKAKAAAPTAAASDNSAAVDQPQIVRLEATNSLLVNATPEQHIQIANIISYVDREPIQNAIPYRIYRLENQEPEALAEVLNNLIEKTVKDKEGKIQSTVKIQDDIAVVPDENTFSLIVYASKKNQEWIGKLIETLDKRRPQVLIDVSLVEVTQNDKFQFDLDLVANAKGLVTENLQVLPLNKNAFGGNREAGFSGGTTTGFYSADKIQALLTMVDSKGYGRVLAQPKILVNDNEEGTIETTQKTYIAEENQSASGTTGEVISKSTTWKDYSAEIKLTITPQISEGDLLRLVIEMTREDFATTKSADDAPPDMTTSNVSTVVTVPDGSTIILGGLNKLNQSKSGNKVPLLGDIPFAGGLFRGVNNSNEERRLYVFVKANILRPDMTSGLNQLKEISRDNQVEFEKAEDRFQKHESFPGIKPVPIEPVHVLRQLPDDQNDVLDVLEEDKK